MLRSRTRGRQLRPGQQPQAGRRRRQGAPQRRPELEVAGTRSWPALSGILWQVVEDSRTPRAKAGGPLNDELLGHHGSDKLSGKGGQTSCGAIGIRFATLRPARRARRRAGQRLAVSQPWQVGRQGRPGIDSVWAYYGKGTIDCGPASTPRASVRTGPSRRRAARRSAISARTARTSRASASRRRASRSPGAPALTARAPRPDGACQYDPRARGHP